MTGPYDGLQLPGALIKIGRADCLGPPKEIASEPMLVWAPTVYGAWRLRQKKKIQTILIIPEKKREKTISRHRRDLTRNSRSVDSYHAAHAAALAIEMFQM
ncbi:Hypp9256 [Branchiostoma lanceolatum]|uniref:Hypp9256 protein n=1 Tax=Branchiostoma lanceolatum TaxID=7740 RepID=A0A8J9ZFE4_BRALA|nr:Hypp9256 [Branchiostoma lanceolatum]